MIPRKSDSVIQVTVNGSDGNAITISGLADLELVVYQKPKDIIQRWLMSDGDVTTIDDANGIVSVNLDRANSKLMNAQNQNNKCYLEVIASITDADFEDNIRREVDTAIELALVEDSPTAYEA